MFTTTDPSKTADIVLKPCEVENCRSMSATLCEHCNKRTCRRHFDEHADQLVQDLHPLADNINKLREKISTFCVQEYKQNELDKLSQWRDEAIKIINDIYEWKKEKLELLIQYNEEIFLEQTTSHLEAANKLKNETAIFVEKSDVTFGQLQVLKQQLRALENRVVETHTRLVYCETKPVPIDYTWILLHSSANNYLQGSALLCADYQMKLNDFYGKANQKWGLIYKGTRDGFRAEDFHRCSDKKGPTLTTVQSQNGGYLFGGYTRVPWDCDNLYKCDPTAFVFTLTNPHGIQPTRFRKDLNNNTWSVAHVMNTGPHFGGCVRDEKHFCDFLISENSGRLKSFNGVSDFPAAYVDTTGKGETLFAGTKTFAVAEIEVFELINEKDQEKGNDGCKRENNDEDNE